MNASRIALLGTMTLALLATAVPPADALNTDSHRLINVAAGDTAALANTLRSELGFLRGAREPFGGRTVLQWLGEGGIREDDGARFFRHFHDPLEPFDTAGLRIGLQFDSSIRWMQTGDNEWSWQRARGFAHTALTSASATERETAWANTFRALGQVMHLVVDASVPEHVRNDIHPQEGICRFFGFRCAGNYEYWVSDNVGAAPSPIGFDAAILRQPTGDAQAPVPVARLIDTNTYTRTSGANVTLGGAIGIGEFANANFFSEDTVDATYPHPDVTRLVASQLPVPTTGNVRAYFAKGTGDGLAVDPVAAECVFYEVASAEGVVEEITRMCQDANVWAATAGHMLPRAVGYARGALDYFFRGRIEIAAPGKFLYGLAKFVDGNTGSFTKLTFKFRNATPGEATTCPAGQSCAAPQLTAIVQYRKTTADPIVQPEANLPNELSFAVAQPKAVAPGDSFQELTFDFSGSPIPTSAADVFLILVYRGPLGQEADAIAVGGKDLFEPDPVTFTNATDYFCSDGTPLHVSDFTAFPPFNPFIPPDPLNPQPRDPNADGRQDIFGPIDEFGTFTKAATGFVFPSSTNFDEQVTQRTFAQYTRFFVLQDQPLYVLSRLVQSLVERGTITNPSTPNAFFALFKEGIVNRLVQRPDGTVVHEITGSFVYRGLPTLDITIFVPQDVPSFIPCLGASFTLSPPLTRIDDIVDER